MRFKYLSRFLENPQGDQPTKPTKHDPGPVETRADGTADSHEAPAGSTYKTDETDQTPFDPPANEGSVGFVGDPFQEFSKIEGVPGPTFLPPDYRAPKPSRSDALPAYGFTVAGHVVELPRSAKESRNDPLRLVTGPGWGEWYDATDADRGYVRNPPTGAANG